MALVIVDEPRGRYYGGEVAAPAFREIMERSLIHMRIPRDLPVQPPGATVADAKPAREPRGPADLSVEDDGSLLRSGLDPAVVSVMNETQLSRGDRVILELDTLTLPDFAGMSLREVAQRSGDIGLKVRFVGQGVAVSQRPAAGREVMKNTVCEVFFSTRGTDAGETSGLAQKRQ